MNFTEADVQDLARKYPLSETEAKTILTMANVPPSAEALAQLASYGYVLSDLIAGFREIERRFEDQEASKTQ